MTKTHMVLALSLIGTAAAVLQDESSFALVSDSVGLISSGFSQLSGVADEARRFNYTESTNLINQSQIALNVPIERIRLTSGIISNEHLISRENLSKPDIVNENKVAGTPTAPPPFNLTIMSWPVSANRLYSPLYGRPQTNIQMLEQFDAIRARSDFDHPIAAQDVASLSDLDRMTSSFSISRPKAKPVKRAAIPIRSTASSKSQNASNFAANRKPQNPPVMFVSRWYDSQRVGLSYMVDIR